MVKVCFYKDCRSSSRNSDIQFIPFVKPWKDYDRTRKWIQLCGRVLPVEKVTRFIWICIKHFPHDADLNWESNVELTPFPFEFAAILEEEDNNRKQAFRERREREKHDLKTYSRQKQSSFESVCILPDLPIPTDLIDYQGKLM